MIEEGGLATVRGLALSENDRLRGEIIARLMCVNAVDIGDICRRHDVRPADFIAGIEDLPQLVEDGLVTVEGERLSVTDRGRPLVRCVAAAFDDHLAHGQGRHSSAI
jgi:oxygen-independent coproporphyrinogen-3 oxidase